MNFKNNIKNTTFKNTRYEPKLYSTGDLDGHHYNQLFNAFINLAYFD